MTTLQIKRERLRNRWTLEHVASSIGVTNQAISSIENGKQKPSYENLVKLEDLFGIPHRELFAENDNLEQAE